MGSKGDCYDNAVCESFHATIMKDLLHRRSWPSKQEARTAIFDYIESFDNQMRFAPDDRLPVTGRLRGEIS